MVFSKSVLEVDSIDGSTVLILYFSIASCDPHEGISTFFLGSFVVWDVGFQFFEELDGFRILIGNWISNLLFLDLSHLGVHVEGALSDWDHALNNIPEDTLVTWSSGQRTPIGPTLIEVKLLHEFVEVQFLFLGARFLLFDKIEHEPVVPLDVSLWVSDLHLFEV